MPLIDTHLDLAWNAVGFERDLTRPVVEINPPEQGCGDNAGRGRAVVSLPDMRRGGIMLCFATLIARANAGCPLPPRGATRIDLDHRSQTVAHAAAHAQLAWYELMHRRGEMRMIRTLADLEAHWQTVTAGLANVATASLGTPPVDASGTEADLSESPVGPRLPVGMVLVMELADAITEPEEAAYWFERGLRQINLVHAGVNRYAHGSGTTGGLTADGLDLLAVCERVGIALDTTHLADQAFEEALDCFSGPVLASHQNCRSLVPGARQFSDPQLRRLIGREPIIGAAMDNWMLRDDWVTGRTRRETVNLQDVTDHIDYVCQLAGHHRCATIGTDLDGSFGSEQAPWEVDSIAAIGGLETILRQRGYDAQAIAAIFHGNALRFLRRTLPARSDFANAPPASPRRRRLRPLNVGSP